MIVQACCAREGRRKRESEKERSSRAVEASVEREGRKRMRMLGATFAISEGKMDAGGHERNNGKKRKKYLNILYSRLSQLFTRSRG